MYNGDPFINIQIDLHEDFPTVQYGLDPEFKEPAPYKFTLTSYEDATLEKPLYSVTGTEYFIRDNTNVRQNALVSFVYRLSVTDANNRTYYSRWFGWDKQNHTERHRYLIASDIARREHVRFNYVGQIGYLLKRKNYYSVREADVDPVTGEAIVDNTSTYGVGKVDGYYSPVATRFSLEGREVNTDYDPEGRGAQMLEMMRIRNAGFPYIEQHDILVTKDGRRHIVTKTDNKYYPGTGLILLQAPTLRLVPPTDTIYSIEIPGFPL